MSLGSWIKGLYNFFFWRSHCASHALAVLHQCLFFVLSQRIGEEKTLKGLMPLRNPQDFALWQSFGGYQKALLYLQDLRNKIQRFCFYCKQAIPLCFTPRRSTERKTRKTSISGVRYSKSCHHERQVRRVIGFLIWWRRRGWGPTSCGSA